MITHKDLWNRSSNEVDDTSGGFIMRHKFMAQQSGEAITVERSFVLSGVTQLNVADCVGQLINSPVSGDWHKNFTLLGQADGRDVLVIIGVGQRSHGGYDYVEEPGDEGIPSTITPNEGLNQDNIRSIKLELTGHRQAINAVIKHVAATFGEAKVASVRWWFKGSRGPQNREMFLEPTKTVLHPEYYPGLGDPIKYLKEYLASDQAILLMAGAPGTGKTTLIRHLICDFNLTADIIYDEDIMKSDVVFQDFLFDNKSNIMLIEDADAILMPRESDRNSLMSRFLNVSDGIIKLPSKKLVFTTNLSDFNKVDPALTRPGRCYGVLHTRALSYEEAIKAAKVANLPIPLARKEYTLAELFNMRDNFEVRKVGFK